MDRESGGREMKSSKDTRLTASEDWDHLAKKNKSTGYADQRIYAFDQWMRILCVERILTNHSDSTLWKSQQMLDFGCGIGDFVKFFSERFGHVVGYDWSTEAISIARRKMSLPNVEFTIDMPSQRGFFSVLLCVTVLQHISLPEDIESCIERFGSVSTPNALVVALESVSESDYDPQFPSYIHPRSMEEWKDIFGRGGWLLEACYPFYNPYLIPTHSFQKYRAATRWIGGLYHGLKRFGIRSDSFLPYFDSVARRTLKDTNSVDGIVKSNSFSRFFVFRKDS